MVATRYSLHLIVKVEDSVMMCYDVIPVAIKEDWLCQLADNETLTKYCNSQMVGKICHTISNQIVLVGSENI